MTVAIVLPVRFIFRDLAVQSTSTALTADEVCVRCPVPPPAGAVLALRLYLPLGDRLETAAEVVASLEGSFRARFQGLDEAARGRLRDLLAHLQPAEAAPSPAGPTDARAHPRRAVRLRVRFPSMRNVQRHAADLSAGGLFLPARGVHAPGDVLRLTLELPDAGAPAAVEALVVRCVTAEAAARGLGKQGIAVQFIGADDSFRERIDALLAAVE